MTRTLTSIAALSEEIVAAPRKSTRRLVALAGAPGSGKSTLAERLAQDLTARGSAAQVVPMDGFHLDNRLLTPMGLLDRKGAPETFDAGGLARLVAALGAQSSVYYPLFDRARDIAIAGAGTLQEDCDTVIVEGNYLLFDAPGWRSLSDYWDVRVQLSVPMHVLRARLIDRWLVEGLPKPEATKRAEGNDLKNAGRLEDKSLPSDLVFLNDGDLT
ncbi:nucleoside/nucleotide kinase family protein [Roseobacter sp. EG26]|uniref:nucleoside/nucleotide kinase family protein n=1 Tax=Roseobacter sp. EG26 TaxID=3412477 RepID=UPI003CE565CF